MTKIHRKLPVKVTIRNMITKNNAITIKNVSRLGLIFEPLFFATMITISHICQFYLLRMQTSR